MRRVLHKRVALVKRRPEEGCWRREVLEEGGVGVEEVGVMEGLEEEVLSEVDLKEKEFHGMVSDQSTHHLC